MNGLLPALLAVLIALPCPARAEEPPFNPGSLWNRPIERGARYAPVPGLLSKNIGLASWLGDTTAVPIYRATDADPEVSVLYDPEAYDKVVTSEWRRFDNPLPIEAQILAGARPSFPYPGNIYSSQSATAWRLPASYHRFRNPRHPPVRIRLPRGARPNSGYDGQLVVYQPDGRVFESYATIVLSGGGIVCMGYRFTDPAAGGDGRQNGLTASMIPTYAGVLTRSDIAAGVVRHAISVKLPGSLLALRYVPPAVAFDRNPQTSAGEPYAGTVPMGGRLAIPSDIDLATLGLETPFGRMIAEAAQAYGLIVVDRGGGGITIDDQAGDELPDGPAIEADLHRIRNALRLVDPRKRSKRAR
jgi:hypothetical protein